MKRSIKRYVPLVVLALCALSLYAFLHVSGREIEGVTEISDACTVTVIKFQHVEWENREEYVLTSEQTQRLKELILSSSFTRNLANMVRFYDHDMYDIRVDFNNQQDFLPIHCIGNEFINVTNQFGGHHLKINNDAWKETLEAILAEPNG